MDRRRFRALLNVAGLGGAALLALLANLRAQGPSPAMPTPTLAPAAPATATPWVQASSPTATPDKPPSVVLRVDKEGRYFFDKEKDPAPATGLADRLRGLREAQGDKLRLVIRAVPEATSAAVTTALERARAAGIKNVELSLPPGAKMPAASPAPTPAVTASTPPAASSSRDEIVRAMEHKRQEELAHQQPPPPSRTPPRGEPPLSPEDRAAYERNLTLWHALPPDEKQALRGQAAEHIREETEKAYGSSGLNLNGDQREVFALRYRQERRRMEREIQDQAKAERARRLPEIMDRLKHEFRAPGTSRQGRDCSPSRP